MFSRLQAAGTTELAADQISRVGSRPRDPPRRAGGAHGGRARGDHRWKSLATTPWDSAGAREIRDLYSFSGMKLVDANSQAKLRSSKAIFHACLEGCVVVPHPIVDERSSPKNCKQLAQPDNSSFKSRRLSIMVQ